MKKVALLCLMCTVLGIKAFAQNFKVSENKDSLLSYLQSKSATIDPEASAVILYEIGSSETIGDLVVYKYEIAYKVYNAKDIANLADIVIPKHNQGIIKKLKGITYNYENGNITEQKIEKPDIIMDNYAGETDVVRFSMPSIKDGSVVTYSYEYQKGTIPSSWTFQRAFPVLYSRFNFNVWSGAIYTPTINTSAAFKKFDNLKKAEVAKDAAIHCEEMLSYGDILMRTWIRRNVPAFKEEALMGPEEQYMERVKLNYNGISQKGIFYPLLETWDKYCKEIYYDKVFNEVFQKNNFLDETVESIIAGKKDSMEMATALFYYVQKNMKINSKESVSMGKILSAKQGNRTDVNMLLCAMLRNAGLQSDLVLLSDKHSDKLSEIVPNPRDITNVVVRVVLNNISYVMDATQKELPFGYLPLDYYNGYARIINKEGGSMNLEPSYAQNVSLNTVYISPVEQSPSIFKFKLVQEYGAYSGAVLRKQWIKDSTELKKILMESVNNKGLKINNAKIERIDDLSQKVRVVLEGQIDFGAETDMMILDPYFVKVFSENPFKEIKNRKYPVEYDHITQEKYKIYIQLNNQFEFDDYPTNKQIAFGDPVTMGFANTVNTDTVRNTVMIQCQYDNQATMLPVADVESLQHFYNDIIKVQNQKVIFKRKK